MSHLRNISIIDWSFREGLIAAAVALIASSFFVFHRRVARWAARGLTLIIAVAFVGASVNAHYDYFPTIGALLGRRAADQVSAAGFRRLEDSFVRTLSGRWHYGAARFSKRLLPVRGVVLSYAFAPTRSHFPARTGQVYLPPIWFEVPHPRLPVIELLHGSPGSPPDWTRGGFADLTADTYAGRHSGFAPILVMPDVNGHSWWHDSECVNGPMGNAEQYLTLDVRRAVVRAFNARPDGASWGIAGLSEGGSCALQIGLRHPRMFAAVGDFSGDDHPWTRGGMRSLFWGATAAQLAASERSYDPRVLLSHWHHRSAPWIVFECGSSDHTLVTRMTRLLQQSRRDHIHAALFVRGGGHDFRFWGRSFAMTLPLMMQHLRVSHMTFASAGG